jgi:hypothetical protein
MLFKTRRRFFYLLFLVFVILGAYLLVNAQGWVLDVKNFRIVKTGALFLKYSPTDAAVRINGKASDVSPGLFSTGVFVSKLIPGRYEVELSRADYSPWKKTLDVGESVVAAESQINLWPDKFILSPVTTSSYKDFWLSGEGAVFQTTDGAFRWDGLDLRGQKITFVETGSNLVVMNDGKNYLLSALGDSETPVNLTNLIGSAPLRLFAHPFSSGKLLIAMKNALFSFDSSKNTSEKLASATSTSKAAASNNEVFLLDKDGQVFSFNLFLRTGNVFGKGLPTNADMRTVPSGSLLFFLKDNGLLSAYDRSLDKFEDLDRNVRNFFTSPDEKKVVIAGKNGSLSVIALEDYYLDLQIKKGDRWYIFPAGEPVSDFSWLNDYPGYGLALRNGELLLAELDSRKPQNIYPITENVKKFFVQGNDLYILKSDGVLYEVGLK